MAFPRAEVQKKSLNIICALTLVVAIGNYAAIADDLRFRGGGERGRVGRKEGRYKKRGEDGVGRIGEGEGERASIDEDPVLSEKLLSPLSIPCR